MRIAVLLAALAGCYSPTIGQGAPCGPNGECPSRLLCINNACLPPGTAIDDAPARDDAAIDSTTVVADAAADATPGYVPWGTPTLLTSLELATSGETDPSVTMNRLTAVLVSDSPDDISECTRTALTDTFTCTTLTAVNSTAQDKSAEISADGTTLYFTSDRSGSYEVYMSTKALGVWSAPTVVSQLSTANDDEDLAISPDGLTAVVHQDTSPNRMTIHTRASTLVPFGAGAVHTELQITTDIAAPSITNGGATIYFHAGATRDLYVAYRMGNGMYTTPSPILELNTTLRDAAPFVSADDKYIIFDRDGDIFEATRP